VHASTASGRSLAARGRRPLVTTNSLPAVLLRHCRRLGPATPTCRLLVSPATEPIASAGIPRPASCASQRTASSWPIWVELFAPVVLAPQRPSSWPAHGSLLLDHIPFRIRAEDASGRGIPGGRVAFDIFCVVGCRAGKPRLWRTEAFSTAHPANWGAFLASLQGEPSRVVCDAHHAVIWAIRARWSDAELHQCEWHLQHALRRLLRKEVRKGPSAELEEFYERAEGALTGPNFWTPFKEAAREAGNESLDRWIAVNGPTIEAQLVRRPPPSKRPAEMPLTTAALEQLTRPIAAALYPRRYALKNRERLNRLLMLMQLHINGDDNAQAYSKAIRTWLEANHGRPTARRRAIADPFGSPSLRQPNEKRERGTA
jgi:hypothetical protein